MNADIQEIKPIPPEIARYLGEAAAEGKQFDFLIGEWDVRGKRYRPDGVVVFEYEADWRAQYLAGGRIVMDEFTVVGLQGHPVSSFVTLRTWSQVNKRWEMAGLQALEATPITDWHGNSIDGAMVLEFTTQLPDGRSCRNRIRFFHIERDSFEWEIRASLDGGQNWGSPLGSLLARRRA